jgi:dUTP pyrophosphatase
MQCFICGKEQMTSGTLVNGLLTCDWCLPNKNPTYVSSMPHFPLNFPSIQTEVNQLTFLKVKKLIEDAVVPTRNYANDAGLDLYAVKDVFVPYEETVKISTGIAVEIPAGYMGQIMPRSSVSSKGLEIGGGVIDAGYIGELQVIMHNLTHPHGQDFTYKSGYMVRKGDKVAQLVIKKIETPMVVEVNELNESNRSSKGFGSSGV